MKLRVDPSKPNLYSRIYTGSSAVVLLPPDGFNDCLLVNWRYAAPGPELVYTIG